MENTSIQIEKISAVFLESLLNKKDFQNKYALIDLRPVRSFEQGHIEHAVNIEYEKIMEMSKEELNGVRKNRIIIVYCERGGRSIYAARKIMGYGMEVLSVVGGFIEYKKSTNYDKKHSLNY